MKIIVVGRGWTGNKVSAEVLRRGHKLNYVSHVHAINTINYTSVDWVINCAGVTGTPNVDACEFNKKETVEGNAIFPIKLQRECEKYNIRFAHFSSGCIYEGVITDVNAEPNYFGSIYSTSKGISDTLLKGKAQVYRIRMPFTGVDEPKNYLSKVMKYATTGKLFDGGQNSLTDLDEAVRVAVDLIEENQPNGYYNLVNKGSVDMHQLANLLDVTPQWFTEQEFKDATVASRSNCVIPSDPRMSSVEVALTNAIKKMQSVGV